MVSAIPSDPYEAKLTAIGVYAYMHTLLFKLVGLRRPLVSMTRPRVVDGVSPELADLRRGGAHAVGAELSFVASHRPPTSSAGGCLGQRSE